MLISPSSPPFGSAAWRLKVECKQEAGGTVVGVYAGPVAAEVPAGFYYTFESTVSWQGVQKAVKQPCTKGAGWGYEDWFDLQPMAAGGGWDAAAWAAAGLPTAGEMLLELCVHSVA
uniref:Uncharacterized protein n=1 Tax=Tetradesmus obliquus TaxID=3088 RepID=A0A383VHZ1_TETOB|eukprot:jgi/Sobl393_1/16178/SZX63986.1